MACKSRLNSERSGDTCLSQETTSTSTSLSGETSHVTENETECSDVSPSEAPLSSKPRFDLGENSLFFNLESIAPDFVDEQSKIKERKEMGNDIKSTLSYLYEMQSCPKIEDYKNGYNCRQNNRRSFALKRRSVPYDYEEMIKQYNAPANRDDFRTRPFSPNSREQSTKYADHYFRKSKTQINRRSLSESCADDEPFLRPDDKTKNRTENFKRNMTIYHESANKDFSGNKSESNSNYECIRGIPNTYSDTSSAVYAAKGAGYAELNTRLDGLVHDFQEQGVQYRVLRKSYAKLKKLFLALAVVNIILIMCNMSVMPMITFLKGGIPGTPGTPEPPLYNKTRVLETVLCVSCSSLKLKIGSWFLRQGIGVDLISTLGKNKFHKSHHFDVCNETSMLVGHEKPGIGGEMLRGQKMKPKNSAYPRGEGSNLPAWVAFDRQVLCFDAYFQEAVMEKREEQYRVRHCKVYFYLEDDSIQVIEPRSKNSGVPQGTLIRRHRIPKPPPHDDEYYTVEDFNMNSEINLYSKVFKITNCDEFTRNFMRKLGVRMPDTTNAPLDPYANYRKAMDESMQPLRPYEKHDTLKQFLDHDRHVLRFYCYWDDTEAMFGDPREMVLHYFLADDTIEIREVIPPNSGRDAAPMFLRRGKLPKNVESLKQPGKITDRTVLNVFGPTGHGGRYILDSLKTGAYPTEFYKDSDLTLGAVLNVWGRKMLVVDSDDFTKEYYSSKYGIEDFTPVSYKKDAFQGLPKQWPPYNGWGSEEDSLCSCMGLLPKPPRRDFIKFMEKDRRGLDSNVLRFLARMETTKPIDMERRFIISYFLSDDTILVFEPPVRNSGIIGGKFLERCRVKQPNQPNYSTTMSEYYLAQDLFVGAHIDVNSHKFILIDADEYAFRYMENNGREFPKAHMESIVERIRRVSGSKPDEVRSFFMRNDPSGTGIIQYDQLGSLLRQVDASITDHEIMSLARMYAERSKEDAIDTRKLLAIAQEQLRKRNFEGFAKLVESFQQADQSKCGLLDADTIRNVFQANHVPIPDDLLRAVMATVQAENGQVQYVSLIDQLNWRDSPVPPMQYQAISSDDSWAGNKPNNVVSRVCYQPLLDDVFGKATDN